MRKKVIYLSCVLILLLTIINIDEARADYQETTWSIDKIIESRYTVEENEHLIIQPGTVVRFNEGGSLYVRGKLTAVGMKDNLIIFTSNSISPFPGIWDKINFKSSASSDSIIRYCQIEYAAQGISISSPYIKIENNFISNVEKYGIKVQSGSKSLIANNSISTQNIAIRVADFAEPEILNNTLENNFFYGVYCDDNSKPLIEENRISNSEWGIYSHLAYPYVKQNIITQCTFGVVNYLSSGTIEDNRIYQSTQYGIKCRYANPDIFNNTISESGKDGIFTFYSSPQIQGNIISNNGMWGILSLGASLNLDYNDFNTTAQNELGWVRQGWYLRVQPKDDSDNPLTYVDITVKDGSDVVIYSGNTGYNETYTIDLTEHVVNNDGTITSNHQYQINAEKKGYESFSSSLTMVDNKELEIQLLLEEPKDEEIPGFQGVFLIIGIMLLMFIYRINIFRIHGN
jgi:parallel beta-helix repeat protein